MASIYDYGLLADAVYDDDPGAPGWTRVAFRPSGVGLTEAFQGAAFQRGGELVFACKGTSGPRDVIADLKLGVGMNSSQFSDAAMFIEGVNRGSAASVVVCGHSLGGAIAQIVGNRLRLPFATFNAPGVAIMSRNVGQMATAAVTGTGYLRFAGMLASGFLHPFQAAQDVGAMFHWVTGVNLRIRGDVVGAWGVHYGKVVDLAFDGAATDVLGRHKMAAMLRALERDGYRGLSLADAAV
ncbi:hypothetical protein [Rubrimonas cliftonensis]|uniref:Lipase (Class 3) n=1 Tax=Rubrimonas cliftonensis TaxID=89524 RepID=A0A1H3ZEA4_9RHOB|nr:hypothetical protein [Rubrimonas cliftonensis]SEA21965.1 hypothetical protein SAMN05444370_103503 [Rubrimonas cliftonensis]